MLYSTNYQYEEEVIFKKSGIKRTALGHLNMAPEGKYHSDEIPEWGSVQFSISLPLPDSAYSNSVPGQAWPKPSLLQEGRYKGIFRLSTQCSEFVNHEKYSPMTFFHNSADRFGENIASSTGTENKSNDEGPVSYLWKTNVGIWHRNRRPENNEKTLPDESKFWCAEEIPGERFYPKENAPSDYAINPNATVELAAFEIIQFPYKINSDTHYQRFLVLHVVAVDCTSDELEIISQSLTRKRSTGIFSTDPNKPEDSKKISLLDSFVKFAENKMNGKPESDTKTNEFKFDLERGGYIKPIDGKPEVFKLAQPARSVCAIPNVELEKIGVPTTTFGFAQNQLERYQTQGGSDLVDKVKSSLWGAQLSVGYDSFAHEVPTVESILALTDPVNDYAYWSITAEGAGISAVRKTPELTHDISLWSLTSTRFVDLIILSQRSFSALHQIADGMRSIENIELKDLNISESAKLDEQENHRKELIDRVNKLLNAQNQFAEVRNTLWFNAVPRRQLDTFILRRVREEMGVQNLYDDLADEVRLRQEVYNLSYHEYDSQFRALEAKIAEQERSKRAEAEQERKAQHQRTEARRIKKEKRNNVMLTVVATAVAIPGYLALVVEDGPHWGGLLLLIFALLMTAIAVCSSPYIVGKIYKYTDRHQGWIDRYLSLIDKPISEEQAENKPAQSNKPK